MYLRTGFAGQGIIWYGLLMSSNLNPPFTILEIDLMLEQEQQHGFCVVGKQHQVDVGLFTRYTAQYRTSQIGMKIRQQAHGAERFFAQLAQDIRVAVVLVEDAVAVQGFIYFLIAGKVLRIFRAQLPRGFALGKGVVSDTILGHQFGGLMRQLLAHQVAFIYILSACAFFGHESQSN